MSIERALAIAILVIVVLGALWFFIELLGHAAR